MIVAAEGAVLSRNINQSARGGETPSRQVEDVARLEVLEVGKALSGRWPDLERGIVRVRTIDFAVDEVGVLIHRIAIDVLNVRADRQAVGAASLRRGQIERERLVVAAIDRIPRERNRCPRGGDDIDVGGCERAGVNCFVEGDGRSPTPAPRSCRSATAR